MIDGPFRAWLPSATKSLVNLYSFLRLTPDAISLASVVIAGVASYFCSRGNVPMALSLWWLGRLFDGTDGIYARATGQTSEFGAYLDIVCDMTSYSIMIFGFLLLHPSMEITWFTILFLYVLCITSALAFGSIEQKLGTRSRDNRGLRLGAGLAEGGETGIAYTVFLLFPDHIHTTTCAWIVILCVTVIARTVLARRVLKKN